jgi:DNA mismatch repair protein MutS
MSVIYDRERDCLIYDRKLRDGQGLKTYGLEVCKSLYLPQEFLETAYGIRNKYYPDTRGGASARTSHYNAKKIMDMCEMCKTEIAGEVHHLQPQKDADDRGYIGTIHKNHAANLVAVCEACHDKFHTDVINKTRRSKTTKGYIIKTA